MKRRLVEGDLLTRADSLVSEIYHRHRSRLDDAVVADLEVLYRDLRVETTRPPATSLWLVGRWIAQHQPEGSVWDFQGIYAEQDEAISTCRDRTYFVAPVQLGEPLPHESSEWPNCWYPLAEAES